LENSQNLENVKTKQFISEGMLLTTAIIWGSGFIPQKIGADNLSAFAFNGIRYLLAALFILILAKFQLPFFKEGGLMTFFSGCILFIAAALQQYGMKQTTIGNASFITTIYVALVPFLSFLLFRQKIKRSAFIAAIFAITGLYFLSTAGKPLDHFAIGDAIVFIGSNFWALHIIIVGKASRKTDPIQFSAGQFLVCATLNLLCWGIFEQGDTNGKLAFTFPFILYSGILVIGGGFTLQAIGQKYAKPSKAAIILGLESVFGSIFGMIFMHETFTGIQIFGAVLIFISVLVAVQDDRAWKDTLLFRILNSLKT
jgi:drug/metabolite transporter (DMT)-like permease